MEKDLHMKINTNKTKVLVCSRYNSIRTSIKLKDGENIEQVEDFMYLGSTISSDGRCKKEYAKLKWHLIRKEIFLLQKALTSISGRIC